MIMHHIIIAYSCPVVYCLLACVFYELSVQHIPYYDNYDDRLQFGYLANYITTQ